MKNFHAPWDINWTEMNCWKDENAMDNRWCIQELSHDAVSILHYDNGRPIDVAHWQLKNGAHVNIAFAVADMRGQSWKFKKLQ